LGTDRRTARSTGGVRLTERHQGRTMTTGGNAVLPLLETKLHAPHRRQGLVTRPRLRQRLDIARELYVSLNTFRTHTKSIYTTLGVNTRREAIRRADELGPGVLSAINARVLGLAL